MNHKTYIVTAILLIPLSFCLTCCNETYLLQYRPGPTVKGEKYTVLLKEFKGANSKEVAELYVKETPKHTGWKDTDLVFNNNMYQLIRGTYASRNEAQSVCFHCKRWKSSVGTKVFPDARVIPVPGLEIGPPERNLKNCKKGVYTYQIAVFYDMYKKDYPNLRSLRKDYVGRKSFAVDYCNQLRKANYEAYYYHGPNKSIVTIGTFGNKAIQTKNVPLYHPDARKKPGTRTKYLLIDNEMKRLGKKFPHMQVNGTGESYSAINPRTGIREVHRQYTYPILIPGREENDNGNTPPSTEPDIAPNIPRVEW